MDLYAGAGVAGDSGENVWGGALQAKFGLPRGLAVDKVGDLYIADGGPKIRRVSRESKSLMCWTSCRALSPSA